MLGFNPLCAAPLADISLGQVVALSGQTIATTLNSVEAVTGVFVSLLGQSLTFTENSVSVIAGTGTTCYLAKQADLAMAVNSVLPGVAVHVVGGTLTSLLNSVTAQAAAGVLLIGQTPMVFTQHGVSVTADANAELLGQTLHFTLNSMRMWKKIDPSQNANWTAINTAQSAGWAPIDTAQSPGWTEIET